MGFIFDKTLSPFVGMGKAGGGWASLKVGTDIKRVQNLFKTPRLKIVLEPKYCASFNKFKTAKIRIILLVDCFLQLF